MYVMNFFGGPGIGKSTSATYVFSRLKLKGINCEYVGEFAKDLTWEDRYVALSNQWYVSATQLHRIHRLVGKVDMVITDSPIILGGIYYEGLNKYLIPAFLKEFDAYDNINYVIERTSVYKQEGRKHSFKEAQEVDKDILYFLKNNHIQFKLIKNTEDCLKIISDNAIKLVNKI